MIARAGTLTLAVASFVAGANVFLAAQSPQIPPTENAPTFSKDIAPILYKNCVSCHRPGEIGPMSLLSFSDVRPWARSIREKVVTRAMPPWSADPHYGKFSNERRLSQDDIDLIVRWVNAGARQGDAADLPSPPQFVDGWQIGQPDLVIEMPVEYQIPAEGTVDYQNFEVPTNFTEDMWVQAVEARPGDHARTHHIGVTVIEPLTSTKQPKVMDVKAIVPPGQLAAPARRSGANTQRSPGVEHELVTWASGEQPYMFPEGLAKRIAAGSVLSFQLHYTTNGAPGKDRSKIGLIFAKKPPHHEVGRSAVTNAQFVIPPGDPNYAVEADGLITQPITLFSIKPHMHLRGKDVTGTLTYPDGRTEVLLVVPKFDFGWMLEYVLAEPLKIPAGSKIHVTAHFDNSPGNLSNPNYKDTVVYGDQTWDEMMNFQLSYLVDGAPLRPGTTARSN